MDAAIAFEAWRLEQQAARCPSCGTRDDDWVDDRGRPLRSPVWRAEVHECRGCRALDAVRPDSKDHGVKGGYKRPRLVPNVDPDDEDDE